MSNGQIGCAARSVPISEQVVAACSFNPLDPAHNELVATLVAQDTRQELAQAQRDSEYRRYQEAVQRTRQEQNITTPEQFQTGVEPLMQEYLNNNRIDQQIIQMLQQPRQTLHNELINRSPVKQTFPGGVQWQQTADARMLPSQQQFRQQIGNELPYLPPMGQFPGGSEYMNTAQRNVGVFGTNFPPQTPASSLITGSVNGVYSPRYAM